MAHTSLKLALLVIVADTLRVIGVHFVGSELSSLSIALQSVEDCNPLQSLNFQHLRALFRMRKEVCARRTRGHALRLEHVRCKCSIRQRFVTNRVVNTWNNLTDAKIRQMQINTHFTGHCRINSNAFVPSVM